MRSYDAIRLMVGGHPEEIAKAIHRSANLVYRWTLPINDYSESGAFNDLDRLEQGMRRSLELGVSQSDALAPIHYLAHAFGGRFLPPVPHSCNLQEFSRQLTRAMKETSEAFALSAQALEDDNLTPVERRRIVKETYEGIHELCRIVSMLEAGEGGHGSPS